MIVVNFGVIGMFLLRLQLYRVVIGLCVSVAIITAQSIVTDPVEVRALQAVRKSLIDVDRNLMNWRRGDPCTSNWTGVMCFNRTNDDGYLHVRELHLLNLNLGGRLSPELGRFSYMKILDFMWNNISGSIPGEIGNMTALELLLLNGNQLTGSLPEEIGYLPNLDRIQVDQNQISGPIPASYANLNNTKHLHMNNNSISGQIPPEFFALRSLVHLLLDNNNLSGYLPPELAEMPNLLILQLDNNNFNGSTIPANYSNMSRLLKLSLRNCSLQGPVPDLSRSPSLAYIDLSLNRLNGSIPQSRLSEEITTIDLSHNDLTGTIPANFSGLPLLQRLSLSSNSLNGSVSSSIWQNRTFNISDRLILDMRNNMFSSVVGSLDIPQNVSLRLQGNPICINANLSNTNLFQFCNARTQYSSNSSSRISTVNRIQIDENSTFQCPTQACPPPYEYAPDSPSHCFCAAPLFVGYRLKSPGFWYFAPYKDDFRFYLTSGLKLKTYQLNISSFNWEEGPRLKMYLKLFPDYVDNTSFIFNRSEVLRIQGMFTQWTIPGNKVFGPFELLNFTLLGPYKDVVPTYTKSGISKGTLAGIVIGTIAGAATLSAFVSLIILRLHLKKHHSSSKRRQLSKISMKIADVKSFTYQEMTRATTNFSRDALVGEGGYGKVYKGIISDGSVVAIKRAEIGSLQGEREFLTEIELLSRLHHRNLVSLFGYCDEESEQMLVYEFMSNGTLRDHLSVKCKECLNFGTRLKVALGSAKGVLYLHTEADPPIFHRDIKATNILLDSNFNPKVADFGLSRLAPIADNQGTIPNHISTVVRGTPGYLDPEYFLTHKLTDKSDVYSIGVVFLELLTGMHPISHGKNIVREVKCAYRSGIIFSIIDQRMGSYPSECVEKFVSLALNCCQEDTNNRPSMAQVVRELEIIYSMMPEPAETTQSSITTDSESLVALRTSSSNPYLSSDVSCSELVSGAVPVITPR